jgi:hypothetical protein
MNSLFIAMVRPAQVLPAPGSAAFMRQTSRATTCDGILNMARQRPKFKERNPAW